MAALSRKKAGRMKMRPGKISANQLKEGNMLHPFANRRLLI
jgi:hypothetical protein